MNLNKVISQELKPVLLQLQSEGIEVYTYTYMSDENIEIDSLYWFENGRILNIQPTSWRNKKYNPDCFALGVSYIPSTSNGSGCRLSKSDWGNSATDLMQYRKYPTWVKNIQNYMSIEVFLNKEKNSVLKFYKIENLENQSDG